MSWIATGVSVAGSLAGGLMGGSKAGERAAKDANAATMRMQEDARRQANTDLAPYKNTGAAANDTLAQLLGIGDPTGYRPKPTRQQFEDQLRNEHFQTYGEDYDRSANNAALNMVIDQRYKDALKKWESGKANYIVQNPGSQGDGSLLDNFTNEDFVKDPGYEFRLAEGEKAANRAASAGGRFDSGGTLKALQRWSQDYASNEFGNAFNRDAANKSRTFDFLSGTANRGLNAAGTGINANFNAANAIGNSNQATANTLGNYQMMRDDNQSNSLQSALQNGLYGFLRNKSVVTPDGGYGGNTGSVGGGSFSGGF